VKCGVHRTQDPTARRPRITTHTHTHVHPPNQIVFVYCDDFLRRCFELPWVHDAEWRELLMPVFEALGVPLHKIVRCLLAAMPPGISIPPHHDTGYWVHYTHRIHLPVVTEPGRVAFRVGPTVARLERYDMPEGGLVELNNQVGGGGGGGGGLGAGWDVHLANCVVDVGDKTALICINTPVMHSKPRWHTHTYTHTHTHTHTHTCTHIPAPPTRRSTRWTTAGTATACT
jgi:hypothetical protein